MVLFTLAHAIGANTAIVFVVNALLLKDPPYAHPGRVGRVTFSIATRNHIAALRVATIDPGKDTARRVETPANDSRRPPSCLWVYHRNVVMRIGKKRQFS
jgi:hypothetical protein